MSLLEIEDCPVKSKVEQFQEFSVTLTEFSDKTQLIISDSGKICVLYQVQKVGQIFETHCLLGPDTEEARVCARILGAQIQKDFALIAFGPKLPKPAQIGDLVNFIKKLW